MTDRTIQILLDGLRGRVEVRGRSHTGVMPGFGGRLGDEQIAAILTYIRSSRGRDAEVVEAEDVRAVRERFADRTRAWTADELPQ